LPQKNNSTETGRLRAAATLEEDKLKLRALAQNLEAHFGIVATDRQLLRAIRGTRAVTPYLYAELSGRILQHLLSDETDRSERLPSEILAEMVVCSSPRLSGTLNAPGLHKVNTMIQDSNERHDHR
jgi:hypothetical protein